MVLVDAHHRIVMVNKQTETLFGYDRSELIGQQIEIIIPDRFRRTHPEDVTEFFESPSVRAMGADRELWGLTKSGLEVPIEIGLNMTEVADGSMALASIIDISERHRRRELEAEHKRDLERSNNALAEFASIASHDLKAPLRNISSLVGWIEEDLAEDVPEDVKTNIELVKERVGRMQTLIDDLLAYSKAGRTAEDQVSVDSRELVEAAVALCEGETRMLRVEFVDELPTLTTDRAGLDLVFRNLISNAIKHHDRDEINLEVGGQLLDGHCSFFVRDDGPGIASEHHERIFEIFKTLKPRDEVEGSGLGLALVKRTVESHGGHVSVSSEDGERGTTFSFGWVAQTA